MTSPADAARERVLDAHAETVRTVRRCADAVTANWREKRVTDRDAVVSPLESQLHRKNVFEKLPPLLADAVDAAGYSLSAPPVAGPPYVAVASRGPILRATVADGRLVVTLAVFEIERADDVGYRRSGTTNADVVTVEHRR